MKRQLQVVVALAVLGVSLAAANAAADGVKLGVGGSDVSIDLPDGLGLEDLCAQLIGQGASVGTLLEAGCTPPEQPDGTTPDDGGDTGGELPEVPGVTPPDDGETPGGEDPPDDGETPGGDKPGSGTAGEGGNGGGRGKGEVESDKDKDKDGDGMRDDREPMEPPPDRKPDGTPTKSNPSVTVADFGPAPIGVPNFVIDQFTIPPFLLPIYQACGTEYGIPWEVLASINRIETAFGTNLNVSSAGALGWMQFIPSSWEAYGVDANNDGRKDPYNPVDAICAAANYLKAAGGEEDLPRAIFAYNHADWYVDEVLLYAEQYGRIPDDLVGSLTGLTEGARFPVAANARYADDISEREAAKRAKPGKGVEGNAADVVSASPTRRGINIYTREDAPVVAVNDGVIKKIDRSKKLGRYLILEDAYGNRFTYAQLGSVSEVYPVPKRERLSAEDFELVSPDRSGEPTDPATAGSNKNEAKADKPKADEPVNTEDSRERLYAFPEREANLGRADLTGQLDELLARRFPGYDSFKAAFSGHPQVRPRDDGDGGAPRGLQGRRRDRARPRRQDRRAGTPSALRDHAHRPRRAEDRPEADPGRLEAARGHGDLPGRGQEPVRRDRRLGRPDPPDVEGAAHQDGRSPIPASRSTPAAARTSRPARSTGACWPRSST